MSKYEPLNQFLGRLKADYWRPTFLELERILDFKLPAAARKSAAWWEKEAASGSRQAGAWADAGWKVDGVDLAKERVTFVRPGTEESETNAMDDTRTADLAQRIRDRADEFGYWAEDGRDRALSTLKAKPFTAIGLSAGVAFAAGVGLGYLLLRSLASPSSRAFHGAEDTARHALATLTDGVHDLADVVGERLRNFRG